MKTKSILFSLLLAATAFTFSQCGGSKKEESHEDHDHPTAESTAAPEASAPQFTVDAKFQQQLATVFTSYVALKDAFVSSDAKKVSAEAATISKSLDDADMKLLTGAAHNDWMNYLGVMKTSITVIIVSSSDIETQRKAFSTLTENLYKSIKAYGLGGTTAYYDFCPMAFDNQGAFWLSDAAEIRNPYFGDKMLTCGNIQEELK